jgi:hypothetical protein
MEGSMKIEWKFARKPNLRWVEEKLANIIEEWYKSDEARRDIKGLTEQMVIPRILSGRLVNKWYEEYSAPQYSMKYATKKKKAGLQTAWVDYWATGQLLQHLRARVKVAGRNRVDLIIAFWGGRTKEAAKKEDVLIAGNMYYRKPYTVSPRPGSNETRSYEVPGTWIRIPRTGLRVQTQRNETTASNAQLAEILSRRMGNGKFARRSRNPPHKILGLTWGEQEWMRERFRQWCFERLQ